MTTDATPPSPTRAAVPATSELPRRPLDVALKHVPAALVWAIVLLLALYFFAAVRTIGLGVLAAGSVACMLHPLARKLPGSRAAGAVVAGVGFTLLAAGSAVGLALLMSAPVSAQLARLPELGKQLDVALKYWSGRLQIDPPLESGDVLKQIPGMLGHTGDVIAGVGGLVATVAVALVFVFIGSIFLLVEPRENFIGPVLPALPPRRQREVRDALNELGPKLRWWLIAHLASMAIVGIVSWLGYTISGINFAIPLALLAGVAELVPTIGPIAAGIVAVLIGSSQGGGQVLGAVLTWVVVQIIESYVLLPLLMKRAVRMPAAITLFSVILWGKVFGVAGLFMAIPLDLTLWTLFKHLVVQHQAGVADADADARPAEASAAPPPS